MIPMSRQVANDQADQQRTLGAANSFDMFHARLFHLPETQQRKLLHTRRLNGWISWTWYIPSMVIQLVILPEALTVALQSLYLYDSVWLLSYQVSLEIGHLMLPGTRLQTGIKIHRPEQFWVAGGSSVHPLNFALILKENMEGRVIFWEPVAADVLNCPDSKKFYQATMISARNQFVSNGKSLFGWCLSRNSTSFPPAPACTRLASCLIYLVPQWDQMIKDSKLDQDDPRHLKKYGVGQNGFTLLPKIAVPNQRVPFCGLTCWRGVYDWFMIGSKERLKGDADHGRHTPSPTNSSTPMSPWSQGLSYYHKCS